MRHRPAPALLAISLGAALVAWTVWLPVGVDSWWGWPPVAADSLVLSLAEAWAFAAQPTVAYLVMIGLAVVLARRRWRDLAGSVLLAAALTVSLTTVLKALVARARPDTPWLGHLDALASYPSGHVSAATALTVAATRTVWRLTGGPKRTAGVLFTGGVVVISVAANRLLLGVHHVSDVLGAVLVGLFAAALAAWLVGGHPDRLPSPSTRQVHVVWHPGRVRGRAGLERFLAREARLRGLPEPVWLSTTAAEHGAAAALQAAEAGADVVLVLGGDGTLRSVLGALAHTPTAVAILACGSGNLLAKNLGVPLDAARAVRLALDGVPRRVDLLRVEVDGGEAGWAATMVGAGADAAVLRDASERSKRLGGPLGYVLAGRRHVAATPTPTAVTVDGESSVHDASLVLVGNVGSLHPGLTLLPGADPADGRLDVLVASPRGSRDVLAMMVAVVLGRRRIDGVQRSVGREASFALEHPTGFQIDGDVIGEVSTVRVTVAAGAALVVCG